MAGGVKGGWRNRIVGHGEEAPDQLLANALNWRIHPKAQQDALSGVLDEVGWVQDIIVNSRTGNVVDGHLRASLAISKGEAAVPVVYVDLSEHEERLILATIDPLSAMAATDTEQLAALLAEVTVTDQALTEMLAGLAESSGVVRPDWDSALDGLPDGDRDAFQQMTFTLTDQQAEDVKAALDRAKAAGDFHGTGNENSNGNALARVCEAYRG